jgi:hypothetical protein
VLFLVFDLALGFGGEELLPLDPLVMFLALAAAGYGMAAGILLEPPRRWRWDQRQRPRAGAPVPRVSDTTKAFVGRVPRTIRPSSAAAGTGTGAGGGRRGRGGSGAAPLRGTVAADVTADELAGRAPTARSSAERGEAEPIDAAAGLPGADTDLAPERLPSSPTGSEGTPPVSASGARATMTGSEPEAGPEPEAATPSLELPTSVEPRAQKSPWAWAAPPEWNREEDDEPPRRTSGRT